MNPIAKVAESPESLSESLRAAVVKYVEPWHRRLAAEAMDLMANKPKQDGLDEGVNAMFVATEFARLDVNAEEVAQTVVLLQRRLTFQPSIEDWIEGIRAVRAETENRKQEGISIYRDGQGRDWGGTPEQARAEGWTE